mgnify:CR=1 FL=1
MLAFGSTPLCRYFEFIEQQEGTNFRVYVGMFTSIQTAYKVCTHGHPPDAFDVIIRTRPDAILSAPELVASINDIRQQLAHGHTNVAAGCVRNRSLVGGDFSAVAFVGSRLFWEQFASSFDVYRQYERLFSRACTKFQKGQADDMTNTSRHGLGCCARPDFAQLFAELRQACVYV